MSSGQKVAFSFLTAIVLFAVFVLFANPRLFKIDRNGFMSQIETRFYKQTKIAEKQSQLDKLSDSCNSYIQNILAKIQTDGDAYVKDPAVKTYLLKTPDPNAEKAAELSMKRAVRTTRLQDDLPGLEAIRLIDNTNSNAQAVDSNRRDVHFSTVDSDSRRVGSTIIYSNYSDIYEDSLSTDTPEIPAEYLITNSENKFLIDKANNRFVISVPFYRTDSTCDASLVCYFSLSSLLQYLEDSEVLLLGANFDPITGIQADKYKGGFVTGIPHEMINQEKFLSEFYNPINQAWKRNTSAQLERIMEGDGFTWLMLTNRPNDYFTVSSVYKSTIFEISLELKVLIYIVVFTTLLLIIFLIFSIQRDYLTRIKGRIKKVQTGIINEYLKNREKVEWKYVARQIDLRKDELSEEIKKSIGGKSKKHAQEIDAYLNASWKEIISVIGAQNELAGESPNGASIDEIRMVLEEVLQSVKLNVNVAPGAVSSESKKPVPVTSIEAASDLDEVEEIDEIEEVEEVEEVEAIDEAEEVEAIEEVAEIEEADTVEEIEEIEDIEEAEAVEEVEEALETETVEEAVEAGEVEEEVVEPSSEEVVEEASEAPVEETEEIIEEEIVDEPVEEVVEEAVETSEEVIAEEPLEEPCVVETDEAEEALVEEKAEASDEEVVEEIEPVEEEVQEIYEPEVIEFNTPSVIRGHETFVSSEETPFATVDSVFAEDLCIGSEYTAVESCTLSPDFDFVVVSLKFGGDEVEEESDEEVSEEVEQTEEVEAPIETPFEAEDYNSPEELLESSSDKKQITDNEIPQGKSEPKVEAEKAAETHDSSVENVLEELRGDVAGKKAVESSVKPAEEIEELAEVAVASVNSAVKVVKSNLTGKSFYTLTSAGSQFGMSQEIGELEDAVEDVEELPFSFNQDAAPEADLDEIEEIDSDEELEESSSEGVMEMDAESANTIVEDEGVFTISENLSYTNVEIDQSFKALVDSVLR